jgi:hypothetical protein
MTNLFLSRKIALAIGATFAAALFASQARAFETCYGPEEGPSWVFAPSTYTHDPMTGARVAQYERKPPVEPLEDERNVTSSYRRTRTNLRGSDGSTDTYYQVQAWGNGRGGLDAEWERFHDAWKESVLSGGYYSGQTGPYGYGAGYGNGPGYGYGNPGYGYGYGGWNNGPGPGNWNGPPNGWNGPNNNGPNGPPPGGNGQHNSGQQGNWHHNNHGQDGG